MKGTEQGEGEGERERERERDDAYVWRESAREKHTNTHDDQKARQEPPELDYTARTALHEIIWIRGAAAYPIWDGRNDISRDDEEGEVVFPEG